MAEPSKKRKGASTSTVATETRRHGAPGAQPASIPPSISSSTLFSSEEQCIRYTSLFSSRSIVDPKFIDLAFFDDEMICTLILAVILLLIGLDLLGLYDIICILYMVFLVLVRQWILFN